MNRILVDIARKSLHVRETGGNNIAQEIQTMQKATWLKPGAWPWCAALMADVLKKAIQIPKYADYIESRYKIVGSLENWRCKDASAFGWIAWANKLKLTALHDDAIIFDERKTAKAGDIVVYDFSHIGIVSIDQVPNSGMIYAIEGNTAPKTTRRDGSSDGVHEMYRPDTLVRAYIRL